MQAKEATERCLQPRWLVYIDAWGATTRRAKSLCNADQLWYEQVLDVNIAIDAAVPYAFFTSFTEEPMEEDSFTRVTGAYHRVARPVVVPRSFQVRFPDLNRSRWKHWWSALRTLGRSHLDAANSAHLLSLNSLHPGKHLASAASALINNRSKTCVLCLSQDIESLEHLVVDCSVACRLWASVTTEPHPPFAAFVCPRTGKSHLAQLERQRILVDIVWRLSRSRRYASYLVAELTSRDLVRLIRGFRARLNRIVSGDN